MSEDSKVTRNMEDYLEAIAELMKCKGYARVKDVASRLGVRPSSVTEMIKKLDEMKYLKYEKYGGMTLTKRGESIADDVMSRHDIIKRFLVMILVSDDTADASACVIEHNLESETIRQINRFVNFLDEYEMNDRLINDFREYCRKEEESKD